MTDETRYTAAWRLRVRPTPVTPATVATPTDGRPHLVVVQAHPAGRGGHGDPVRGLGDRAAQLEPDEGPTVG